MDQSIPKFTMLLLYPRHFQSLPIADNVKFSLYNLGIWEVSQSGHSIFYHKFANPFKSAHLKTHFLLKPSQFNVDLPLNP